MALETYWIQTYKPTYNILLEAGNSLPPRGARGQYVGRRSHPTN